LKRENTWRKAPLSGVREIKAKGKIWLEGRAASPCAERGRHLKNVCGEVDTKRHYNLGKRAFDGAKLAKFYRKLNSGIGLTKINIEQKQSQSKK
jgi:hypothetical protein